MKNKKILIGVLFVTLILFVGLLGIVFFSNSSDRKENAPEDIKDTVELRTFKNGKYYIIKDDYKGDYDIQKKGLNNDNWPDIQWPDVQEIMSYDEYVQYCNEWELKQKYTDESKNYIVFSYSEVGAVTVDVRLAAIEENDDNVNLYIWDSPYGVTADITFYTIVIPTEENNKEVLYTNLYTKEEYEKLKKYSNAVYSEDQTEKKPVIYLYPEKEINIEVNLENNSLITTSYPKYKDKWMVKAFPDGTLIDINTKRELYCLYYEAKSIIDFPVAKEGFIVKGEDAASFLEEKLAILGLNEKETEEFIIYWLPILEANKYNYIRFASNDEINTNMPLNISPEPDTIIRVLMTFKGLDEPIDIKEQVLEKVQRTGYTVVEWGGTEIK